ncbi:hypothetical protein [Rhizosphaericola mali]|uniref:PEGA domain-containing protein n=1 Tax=Rhizosphaericola mali TaxID=2545455 RepID=A0A5P2G2J9_9BACT|nr:hypothetical protein [Rhizosphaericola mali]QES89705.1 hypothetical protein E0W69_013885 [Rhizosphaericola mali]
MKKNLVLVVGLFGMLTLNSCGVIFGGSKYHANIIVRDHPNADIYVNGDKIGTGSANGLYKRDKRLKVEVKQNDCPPLTKEFDRKFRTGNFILSCVGFGLIGLGVDLGTGAAYKPDDSDPNITRETTKDFTFKIDYTGCPTK